MKVARCHPLAPLFEREADALLRGPNPALSTRIALWTGDSGEPHTERRAGES